MRSRAALVSAFLSQNADLAAAAGGPDADAGHAAYDAVNERHERRGCRRVRTLRAAAAACCYREGRTWRLDLATLNESEPARAVGGFRPVDDGLADLPAWVTDDTPPASDDKDERIARLASDRRYLIGELVNAIRQIKDLKLALAWHAGATVGG